MVTQELIRALSPICDCPTFSFLIGKTCWLQFVLILRFEAGLPTIYQSQKKRLFFLSEDGVFSCDYNQRIPFRHEFMSRVPSTTWCLVDSNRGLMMVPPFLTDLGLFIVQVSSPRSNNVDWIKKALRLIFRFYMKVWDLTELLVG